jgi:hypothetical protein
MQSSGRYTIEKRFTAAIDKHQKSSGKMTHPIHKGEKGESAFMEH